MRIMQPKIIHLISPIDSDPKAQNFSPGRLKKISQLLNLASKYEIKVIHYDSSAIRVYEHFCKFAGNLSIPMKTSQQLMWIYNSRPREAFTALLVATFSLILRRNRMQLILQVEDLPGARKQNAKVLPVEMLFFKIFASLSCFILVPTPLWKNQFRLKAYKHKILLFPPLIDNKNDLSIIAERDQPFSRHSVTNIIYAGALSNEKGLTDIIHAINGLDPEEFIFNFYGSASAGIINELHTHTNVFHHGFVSYSELIKAYSQSDISLNPHAAIDNTGYIYPCKINEQILVGCLPIFRRQAYLLELNFPQELVYSNECELLTIIKNGRWHYNRCKDQLEELRMTIQYDQKLLSYLA